MKKAIYILFALMIISSCTSCTVSKEAGISRNELRKEKNLAEQAMVREAIESKRFIVRFNRIYFRFGGMIDLVPRANFIIVDGDKAVISAAYFGRQHTFRPIAGITMRGKTVKYEVKDIPSKGKYELDLKVNNQNDTFDIFMTVGENGSIQASMSSIRIDNVRYTGHIIPIKEKKSDASEEGELI
jgi:hypothetical protein